MREPSEIGTMTDLRVEIDALDRQLVALLAARARLIDRAAELKPGEGLPARITPRVEEVIANARAEAEAHGWDPDLAEAMWRQMVEWSIAREEAVMGPGDQT
jgi:isochorismate pyruvate lyase